MAFNFAELKKIVLKDNPTYERVKTSDLHALMALLGKGSPSASAVAAEMRKVPKDKWRKYAKTKEYLFKQFPSARGKLVKFRTSKLGAAGAGAIQHVLVWESDTGDMDDIAHVKVREHVSWKGASTEVKPYVISEYQSGGHHYGQGNAAFTPGNVGRGDDTHAALGPFGPKVLQFKGPGALLYEMDQVYEQCEDGGSWTAIPKSTFKIVRKVTHENGKTRLTITKSGGGGSCTNSTDV